MQKIKTSDPAAMEVKRKRLEENDPIARMVRDRFRRAQQWRAQEVVGSRSVDCILTDSYEQYHGILSARDRELVAESGVDVSVSLTKHKCDVLTAWMRDLMVNTADTPFTIEPTPVPELSAQMKQEALAKIKQQIFAQGIEGGPEQVLEMVRTAREQVMQAEIKQAEDASRKMERLISDQLVEGGFRTEFMNFLFNFALYPYAVLLAPTLEMRPTFTWSGKKPVTKMQPVLAVRNIDPRNYFWSPDSPGAGQGTYDIVVDTMTRQRLIECMGLQGYIQRNVKEALEFYSAVDENRNWLMSKPTDKPLLGSWALDESVDVVRHWGMLSGRELREYGLMVDDKQFHECEAVVLGYWTIRVLVNPSPNITQRPIYASSYQKLPGKVAGYGVAQNLRDIERSFMVALRGVLENVGYSIAPLSEVDFSRVQRYLAEDQIGQIMPGTMVPVDPDITGGGRPAHYFHTVPSVVSQMVNLMQYFLELADRHTGLPAALSGQPIGTGVNRTFRGIMALYGNALKGVQSALTNIDNDVFERLGTSYFDFNMKFAEDETIKGDARVKARGTAGLMQREIAKQGAQESLMLIAQLAQSQAVGPATLNWAVSKVLEANGVPAEAIAQDENARQAAAAMQQGMPGAQEPQA